MRRATLCLVVVLVGSCGSRALPSGDAGGGRVSHDATTPPTTEESTSTLTVEGEVCLPPPAAAVRPVKVALVVDTSQSMNVTDPNGQRIKAVKDLLAKWGKQPHVSFAIIAFDSAVRVNGSPAKPGVGAFTNNSLYLNNGVESLESTSGGGTDIHGALATLFKLLEKDMSTTSSFDRPMTNYQIVLLADGAPSPSCHAGCSDTGDDLPVICNNTRAKWCNLLKLAGDKCSSLTGSYVALEPCKDYNTEKTVQKMAHQIAALGKTYGVGQLQLHTRMVGGKSRSEWVADELRILLMTVAQIGGGTFLDATAGEAISFSELDMSRLPNPFTFGLHSLVVTNTNARLKDGRLLADSDADGLTDAEELAAGSNHTRADSDGDGYGDLLETQFADKGYDPGDPALPKAPCADKDRQDADGDWLGGCEEQVLGSDDKLLDSDRDRIPDGLEHLSGTAVHIADAEKDWDNDGADSATEICVHTDPWQPDKGSPLRYRYSIKQSSSRCYEFKVVNVGTVGLVGGGKNTIMVLAGFGWDRPEDYGMFYQACAAAPHRSKQGFAIKLVENDFHAPAKTKLSNSPCLRPR